MSYLHKIVLLVPVFLLWGCAKDKIERKTKDVKPNHFLAADKYDRLVVEIRYVDGYAPKAQSVNNLVDFLRSRLNKPGGITVVQGAMPSPGVSSYTLEDIEEAEQNSRTELPEKDRITAYFFFADAGWSGDGGSSKTLGIAYGTTSMAIFEKTVRDFSGGLTQPSEEVLETTVMEHEFGHILGLVNNGTSLQSQHQDAANGRHCNVQDCLMHYTAETSDIVANLTGGKAPNLDPACIADLQGNGGK